MRSATALVVSLGLLLGGTELPTEAAPYAGTTEQTAPHPGRAVPEGTRPAGSPVVPEGDEIVFGDGDTSGYHLYAAGPADGWTWHALATIQPGHGEDERWIGQQCLTGDGRWVVVVVAPWSAANSEAGMNSGGMAYAVDAHTGAVRPLASGVSLAYFNPGCGTGSEVALTSYLGRDQRPTRVGVLDVASGRQTRTTTVRAEITSAVPAGDRIVAARGGDLVDVTDDRIAALHRFPGRVTDVTPSAGGGVHLIAHVGGTGEAWGWAAGHGRRLATGTSIALHLHNGRSGRTIVSGAAHLEAGSGLVSAPAAVDPDSVSLSGGAALPEQRGKDGKRADVLPRGAAGPTARSLPAPLPLRTTALPKLRLDGGTAAQTLAMDGEYVCAVPRNDVFKQVWQPTSEQVLWAVSQAVQGALKPGLAGARPAHVEMYARDAGKPLAPGYPSEDFPLVSGAPAVPPLVLYGILAQESNFSQASWHALPGRPANPLIANYYGTGTDGTSIDYSQADCGYGIAQITDGMRFSIGATIPSDQQVRVAVDYATNIAAAVTVLQDKWLQLHSLGITMNDDDPTKVENWYAAIWGYNSGVHTDPADRKGLGWFNNPANPIYPPRHAFLHDRTQVTYGDARTPSHWPYQERVFGWIDVPQMDTRGYLKYRGSYDWDDGVGRFLQVPGPTTFCDVGINYCLPGQVGGSSDPCPSEDTLCWWDKPVTWTDCATSCTTSTPGNAPNGHAYFPQPGAAEPHAGPDSATCSLTGSADPGANAIVVDDTALGDDENPARLTPNLMNCDSHAPGAIAPASANATFRLVGPHGEDVLNTPSSVSAIDLHQIGGGAAGHVFFTHTAGTAYADTEVRGQWAATLTADPTYGTVYQVKAFVPDLAAATGHATYEIDTSDLNEPDLPGAENNRGLRRTVDQGGYVNAWAPLGYYLCGGPSSTTSTGPSSCRMTVTLRSITPDDDGTQGSDTAFDAVAFVPVPTGGYVALGDSYSSGEGLGGGDNLSPAGWEDGTDVSQNNPGDHGNLCHRGTYNWPYQVAIDKNLLNFIDLTCSGSNLGDVAGLRYYMEERIDGSWISGLYTAWFLGDGQLHETPGSGDDWLTDIPNNEQAGSAFFGEPSTQLQLLRALRPRLVTLTVGGNDVGFADIINTCLHSPPSCLEVYGAGSGQDKLDARIDSLKSFLTTAYQDIAAAAGGADKVYVVTYPGILTPPDESGDPTATDCVGMTNATRRWLRPKVTRLAGVIKAAATEAHIHSIDISGLFDGHEACTGDPYITLPNLLYAGSWPAADNWFHPNQAGYDAMSRQIARQITIP
ncbi:SGNH/GDSL hydrolase family protein [Microbispora rosea]|uniref:SGNH/GDSL hydrolase family protein n=1 Tax=Microbispora rosea TaxID=58117 RepID=UPI0034261BBE